MLPVCVFVCVACAYIPKHFIVDRSYESFHAMHFYDEQLTTYVQMKIQTSTEMEFMRMITKIN